MRQTNRRLEFLGAAAAVGLLLWAQTLVGPRDGDRPRVVIIQAEDMSVAAEAVRAAGGEITHELGIINSVAAELTPDQVETVRATDGVTRVADNRAVKTLVKPTKPDASTETMC